jgi:hypothetical protein
MGAKHNSVYLSLKFRLVYLGFLGAVLVESTTLP